jgi:hypothetical protein
MVISGGSSSRDDSAFISPVSLLITIVVPHFLQAALFIVWGSLSSGTLYDAWQTGHSNFIFKLLCFETTSSINGFVKSQKNDFLGKL